VQQKNAINRLIGELSRLPGIGRKTAERLAYFIVKENGSFADELARAIREVKERVAFCSVCGNLTEEDPCAICSNPGRNGKTICVVEEPKDVWAIEKTGTYSGLYHVLMGSLSPLDGIGPDKLRIRELLSRVTDEVEEIIIATDPNVEGDATALSLARLLGPLGVLVTRIASGLPVGGDLEYADAVTLSKAIDGRRPLS